MNKKKKKQNWRGRRHHDPILALILDAANVCVVSHLLETIDQNVNVLNIGDMLQIELELALIRSKPLFAFRFVSFYRNYSLTQAYRIVFNAPLSKWYRAIGRYCACVHVCASAVIKM